MTEKKLSEEMRTMARALEKLGNEAHAGRLYEKADRVKALEERHSRQHDRLVALEEGADPDDHPEDCPGCHAPWSACHCPREPADRRVAVGGEASWGKEESERRKGEAEPGGSWSVGDDIELPGGVVAKGSLHVPKDKAYLLGEMGVRVDLESREAHFDPDVPVNVISISGLVETKTIK